MSGTCVSSSRGSPLQKWEFLTRSARNLVNMAGDFARADNRINSACLDDRAAHTPERIRKAGQGAKGQEKQRGLVDKHDGMVWTRKGY